MVKKPDHVQIFTLALRRFAEAILRFQEEKEEEILRAKYDAKNDKNNPFKNEMKETENDNEQKETSVAVNVEFATNCAAAFDVVFNNWRKQNNITIKLAVAESIGLLTEVMSKKKSHLNS